jgi:hypothetical protein
MTYYCQNYTYPGSVTRLRNGSLGPAGKHINISNFYFRNHLYVRFFKHCPFLDRIFSAAELETINDRLPVTIGNDLFHINLISISYNYGETMVGFDARNKDILDLKFICPFCSLILQDPVQLSSCGHRQCQSCFDNQSR